MTCTASTDLATRRPNRYRSARDAHEAAIRCVCSAQPIRPTASTGPRWSLPAGRALAVAGALALAAYLIQAVALALG